MVHSIYKNTLHMVQTNQDSKNCMLADGLGAFGTGFVSVDIGESFSDFRSEELLGDEGGVFDEETESLSFVGVLDRWPLAFDSDGISFSESAGFPVFLGGRT